MIKYLLLISTLTFLVACQPVPPSAVDAEPITRYDRPKAPILKGVTVPEDKKLFFSSGQVSDPNHPDAPEKTLAAYGNTYDQSIGTLKKLKSVLNEAGLGMEDVIYLGVFIAPDPSSKDGKIDFDAWFKAYGEYFNNDTNPVKTARTTLGVAALARDYLLVEVEAIAVYPEGK